MTAGENRNIGGNHYDKYNTRNPIARYLMNGFLGAFEELVSLSQATSSYEVGCGEGELSLRLAANGMTVSGSDVEEDTVAEANTNALARGFSATPFAHRSLYELTSAEVDAELLICCEVLEHVADPQEAVRVLAGLGAPQILVSVPREPLWRAMNMARGKYLGSLGNTPGHIQHWSASGFVALLESHFRVVELRKPIPWSMALCTPRGD